MSKSSPSIEELRVGDRIWISHTASGSEVRVKGDIAVMLGSSVTLELDGGGLRTFNLDFAKDFGYLDRSALPAPDLLAQAGDIRMDAYYYGFEKTGVGIIDEILSAVAIAGKHLHSTEYWADEDSTPDGITEAQRIQLAANRAAAAIRTAVKDQD